MKNNWIISPFFNRFCAVLFGAVFILSAVPLNATDAAKTVRVGRFPYDEQLRSDGQGNYTGYGYEYLQEIARYTGWRYEFVDAPWNECLSMLERGEIDLMGAVMRSAEREKRFDFSTSPMISGYGVLATARENAALPYEDFKAFDGLTVGTLRGNQHTANFLAYSRVHGFTPVMREYDSQDKLEAALNSGAVDAAVMTNTLRSETLRVVAIFGENNAYFAVPKGNTVMLTALDEAMRKILLRDPYFNSKLDQKYYDLQASTAVSFTRDELAFISNSQPVPCVYIPEAPPISYFDKQTGSVQGVAVDVCRLLEKRTGLTFQWINTASSSEAVKMLQQGKALVIAAKYDDFSWAEKNNVLLTTAYLQGQMVMVTGSRTAEPAVAAVYDEGSQSVLAASAVSKNARIRQYATIVDCMDAVLRGEANATFINSTIASYLLNNPKYSALQTSPLYGFTANVSMAVSGEADPLLLSVLNKGLRSISSTEMNQFLLLQMKRTQAGPLITYLYQHPIESIALVIAVFAALGLALLVVLSKMWKMLFTDPLTGYPNYRALSRKAAELVSRSPEQFALVYLDIRRFKVINDTFGYEAGDQVLVAASRVFRDFIKPYEGMARIHADTFVLLLRYAGHESFETRLDDLSRRLDRLPLGSRQRIKPLFRGGVYPLTEEFDNLDKACDRANYAKGSIVHLFSNTFAFYDDVIHSLVLAEKELEDSMTLSLERGEFVAFYQPKINAITEKVAGAEALVRWNHPEKGCLPPSVFIPFYEQNGFIVEIDLCVFEQVCRDIRNWINSGRQIPPVSVNFSRRNIQNKGLPQKLEEITKRYGVPAHLLEIEVTETEELEDVDAAIEFVGNLKAAGFKISIDDYGTGYSSITFLQRLPFDVLKLDRKFILNAMETEKAKDIMRYLVSAMQKNNIRILCEGIENTEQRDFVISLNCRFIQGFLYSPPLSRTGFDEYLILHDTDDLFNPDSIPIVSFEKNYLVGIEDFLTQTMPSWVFSCFIAPGYPVNYISPNLLTGLGYGKLEFMIATNGLYINAVHPDDLDAVLDILEQNKDSVQDITLQYRLRKKDGSYLWVREVNKRILLDDGKEAMLGICTNITDIVALQDEKNHLIDAIPGGVAELLITENGPIIKQASDLFYEIIGHTPQEMAEMGNNLCGIFYGNSQDETMNTLQQVLAVDAPVCECSFRIQHKQGDPHWITLRGALSRIVPERLATVIVYDNDEEIHKRKEAEIERVKLDLALSLTGQAVFEYDVKTKKIEFTNTAFAPDIFKGMLIDEQGDIPDSDYIHPDDREKVRAAVRRIIAGETRISYEVRIRGSYTKPDGEYFWLRVTLSTVFDDDKKPVRAVGVVEDINRQKRIESDYIYEAQYRRAFSESALMAYEFNLTKDTIQRITGSRGFRLVELCRNLKNPDCFSEVFTASIPALVAQEDRERFTQELSREALLKLYHDGVLEKEVEYRRITMDGQILWNSALVYLILDTLSGDIVGYAYHRDIQERKAAEQGLLDKASCDSLTGVLNRAAAEKQIQDFLARYSVPGKFQAFLMFDLNCFKEINDTYGHLVGDNCLVEFAQCLLKHVRSGDIVARMGGDEFAVLLKNIPNTEAAGSFAARLIEAASQMGERLGFELPTGVSVGIAFWPQHGLDFETLYQRADKAMYKAKQETASGIEIFAETEAE